MEIKVINRVDELNNMEVRSSILRFAKKGRVDGFVSKYISDIAESRVDELLPVIRKHEQFSNPNFVPISVFVLRKLGFGNMIQNSSEIREIFNHKRNLHLKQLEIEMRSILTSGLESIDNAEQKSVFEGITKMFPLSTDNQCRGKII